MTATRAPHPGSAWGVELTALARSAPIPFLSPGVRHGFGLFLQPATAARGWGREVFGFAIALRNLRREPALGDVLAVRHGARGAS